MKSRKRHWKATTLGGHWVADFPAWLKLKCFALWAGETTGMSIWHLCAMPLMFLLCALQVPYLEDRNTNEAYFETKAIISYINDRYAR